MNFLLFLVVLCTSLSGVILPTILSSLITDASMNPLLQTVLTTVWVLSVLPSFALAEDTTTLPDVVNSNIHININLPPGLCANEAKEATKQENSDHMDLMRLAVCMHKANHPQAIDLYQHIRTTTPDFSYVLVNLGVLAIKRGDINDARQYLLQYLSEVGGVFGEGVPVDRKALTNGTPCRPNARGKIDCVNALNNLGALELTEAKSASAVTFYLSRAIEIGDESMLVDTYANYGGHLAKIGDNEGAADAFIRGFWVNLKQGLMAQAAGLLVRRAFLVPTVAYSFEEVEQSHTNFKRRINDIIYLAMHGGSSWLEDGSDLFRVSNGISTIEDVKMIPKLAGVLNHWTNNIQLPHFFVHYYGWHDLPLNRAVADMFTLLCPKSLYEIAPHLVNQNNDGTLSVLQSNINPQKKKIGFVSSLIGGDEPHGELRCK